LLTVTAWGAWSGFPVFDDAYLVLFVREAGVDELVRRHSHRPVFGWLLAPLAHAFHAHPAGYVLVSGLVWIALAWLTWRLADRLFPQDRTCGPMAATLSLAPLVVLTHYTTVTTVLPANLPVCLSLVALDLGLSKRGDRPIVLAASALLAMLAAVISEYGVAAAFAGAVLLFALKHRRSALALLIGLVFGYAVFRAIGRVELRPRQVASAVLPDVLTHPLGLVYRLLAGYFYALVGGIAGATSKILTFKMFRDAAAPMLFGLACASAMLGFLRRPSARPSPLEPRAVFALALAIAAAMFPVSLAGQPLVAPDAYVSRYLVPALPFASIGTVLLVRGIVAEPFRRWVNAFLVFVAGYTVVCGALEVRARQRRFTEVGDLLHSIVMSSSGIAVAIVPDNNLDSSDLTPKATVHWEDALLTRAWVAPDSEALDLFGSPHACRNSTRIDAAGGLLGGERHGPVARIVRLPTFWDLKSPLRVEPYCER
jgi:hypothetical protein